MKYCTYCGKEYGDDVEVCPIDNNPVQSMNAVAGSPPPLEVRTSIAITHDEKRFWERMTFRQFAVLMIRLQALWLFFYAAVDATYLPRYLVRSRLLSNSGARQLDFDSFLALIRIILHIAAGVFLILYAEKVLSWMVKDLVIKAPLDTSPKTTVPSKDSAGSDS